MNRTQDTGHRTPAVHAGWICSLSSVTLVWSWFYSTYWAPDHLPLALCWVLGATRVTSRATLAKPRRSRRVSLPTSGSSVPSSFSWAPHCRNGPRRRAKGRHRFPERRSGRAWAPRLSAARPQPWRVHLLVIPVRLHCFAVILEEALQSDSLWGAEDLQRRSRGSCRERDALRPKESGLGGVRVGGGERPPGPVRTRLGARAHGHGPVSRRLWPLAPRHTHHQTSMCHTRMV